MSTKLDPIAIVGMAGLFPKASNLSEYWQNIVTSRDCISDLPEGHSWQAQDYLDSDKKARDKTWCSRGGFIDPVPFDPLLHGIQPNAFDATDTSQLLSLIVSREALKDAGIDPNSDDWDRDRVSCILGVTGTQELAITLGARLQGPTWRRSLDRCGVPPELADAVVDDISNHFPEWSEQSFPGLLGNVIAGRIANRLDLGGTNCVVDAACASSLAAVQLAIADLQTGRSDLALTGGVDTLNDIFMYMCFSKTPALSQSGDARPFDKHADGILISEGVGIMVLKRLSDAERDGDRVYAVIKGIGSSSDGRSGSIYAPSPAGQAKAIRRAYEDAGFDADTIGLIEAHGTGTAAGDAAEIAGLVSVFEATSSKRIPIGSIKSQIGHTKSAAGAAGLMKGALALHHKVLPPTTRVREVADALKEGPLFANTQVRPWIHAGDTPRRAGISAFGFGGSNFHAALEEHPASAPSAPIHAAKTALYLVGGSDAADLRVQINKHIDQISSVQSHQHLAHNILSQWTGGAHIIAFTSDTLEQANRALVLAEKLITSGPGTEGDVTYAIPTTGKTALLFPGQGSQVVNMGADLALNYPIYRQALDRADQHFAAAGRTPLSEKIYPPPAQSEAELILQQKALTATEWAQPALGAVECASLALLQAAGIKPDATAGHSFGELTALHAAGVWDEETLFSAARIRGEAMASGDKDRGTMAAISAPLEKLDTALKELNADVVIANRNHPSQGVISGSVKAIEATLAALKERRISGTRLAVSAAFHSTLVADAAAPFAKALKNFTFSKSSIPVYANTTAAPYPSATSKARALLASQITSAVHWEGLIRRMYDDGIRTFVECGPRAVLRGLIKRTLRKCDEPVTVLALDGSKGKNSADKDFKLLLAGLALTGVLVDPSMLLAASLPPMPREATNAATIWIGGANYKTPTTKAPAMPINLPKLPTSTPSAAATQTPTSFQIPQSSPTPAPASQELQAALEVTRSSLLAFQAAQERIAAVHTEFLQAHAQANENFKTLFATHAALVSRMGGTSSSGVALPVMPQRVTPTTTAPTLALDPTVHTVQHSFLAASPGPPTPTLPSATPAIAVALDLPQVLTASTMNAKSSTPSPSAVSKGTSLVDVTAGLLAVVAQKTGYPESMLELSMDLETDLGVDSIKRVEIMAAVQEAMPNLPEVANEKLSAMRTLQEIATALGAAQNTAPPHTPSVPTIDVTAGLIAIVAQKTGYPESMLELSMDLETDLGVDSIKRVEIMAAVQEAMPNLPEVANEKLSAMRTLQEIATALSPTAQTVSTDVVENGHHPSPTPNDASDPTEVLFNIVANKTGYPVQMLELSMDLESDLGVDSIKRVEIMSAAQEVIPSLQGLDSDMLQSLRTLEEIAAVARGSLQPGPNHTESVSVSAPAKGVDPLPARREVMLKGLTSGTPAPLPEPIFITNDRLGVAKQLAAQFTKHNVNVQVVDTFGLDDDAVMALLPVNTGSIVHCAAIGAQEDELNHAIRAAFLLAKSNPETAAMLTLSGRGGQFGRGQESTGSPNEAALAGLTKTLLQERSGRFVAFDIHPEVDAAALFSLLTTNWHSVEVGMGHLGDVVTLDVPEIPLPEKRATAILNKGDLVLVSGGARGVTAAVVGELAKRVQPTLLLLGRSVPLDTDPTWAIGHADDDLKAAFVNAATKRVTPKLVNQETKVVIASREVRANIAAIEMAGATVYYTALDVRDADAVRAAVRHAEKSHGPVRGIIHAAGVLADKLVTDKTPAQFDLVFSTKVVGLDALLSAVNIEDLSLVSVFSSVAGRFGNQGQCDYAMANEAITQRILSLPEHIVTRAFDWGPWDGGMVTPALKRAMRGRGLSLIDLTLGANFFNDEIERAQGHAEVVVGGPISATPPSPPTRPLGKKTFTLDPKTHGFLTDHTLNDVPVLPAVMVLEWMSQAATEAFPHLHLHAIKDLSVLRGVQVPKLRTVDLTWSQNLDDTVGTTLNLELRDPTVFGPMNLLYKAQAELRDLPLARVSPPSPPTNSRPYPHNIDDAYSSLLFHGPAFRGIQKISGQTLDGITGVIQSSSPEALSVKADRWHTNPVAIDSLLQLMVLWVRETTGSSALPSNLGRYEQYAPITGTLHAQLIFAPTNTATGRFDATLTDSEGSVIARILAAEFTAQASLNEHFHNAVV